MSVLTARMDLEIDAGRKYPQLPDGVRPWWAAGTMTGDATGGLLGTKVEVNPNSDRTFDQYFVLTRCSGLTTVVDPSGIAYVQQNSADWERTTLLSANPTIGVLDFKTTGAALDQWAAVDDAPRLLGRVATGQTGDIWTYMENVDTLVANIFLAGFVADYPIIGWADWRA